jgi:hypothetical protein
MPATTQLPLPPPFLPRSPIDQNLVVTAQLSDMRLFTGPGVVPKPAAVLTAGRTHKELSVDLDDVCQRADIVPI